MIQVLRDIVVEKRARGISIIYLVVASVWIVFSDRLLYLFVDGEEQLLEASVYKGIFFVVVTSLMLLVLVGRAMNDLRRGERSYAEILESSKRFADAVIESLPGVLYFYDEERRLIRWNRNLEIVTGYSADEMKDKDPLDFFEGDDRDFILGRIGRVFEEGSATAEAAIVGKDGTRQPYYFTGIRVELDGKPCLMGVGIDISDRVAAEQELRDLNLELESKVVERTQELQAALSRAEAADRMKSAFLATMSHELRTPLNSIIGFTGILLQGLAGDLNDEQRKQLGMVQRSVRHLLDLINDILDISRIEAGQVELHLQPFLVPQLLSNLVESLGPMVSAKGLSMDLFISEDVTALVSDERRVRQIVLNLVNNAVKFTQTGGVVVRARMDAGALEVEVEDTGIGIPPEEIPGLFAPFHQVDAGTGRRNEGTGLGLAISQRLATLLGGRITVRSEPGSGSTFTITLPSSV